MPWSRSTAIRFKVFLQGFLMSTELLVIIYALKVVAWSGVLFLLFCKVAPAMCWIRD